METKDGVVWGAQAERLAARGPRQSEVPQGSMKFIDPMEPEQEDRKIIYQGLLRLVVAEVEPAIQEVAALSQRRGGYVQQMDNDAVLIRVPSEQFDQAVEEISEMGSVVQRRIQAVDVGEQYTDLEMRIRNLEELAETYRELLKKAAGVEETLQIHKELANVTGELERLKGRLRNMQDRVEYATLEVQFTPQTESPEQLQVALPFYWLGSLGIDELLASH
jgi:DNA repair ATPase RecN